MTNAKPGNRSDPPKWLRSAFQQVKLEFDDCLVCYACKDFGRHHSIEILNPGNDRQYSIRLQEGASSLLSEPEVQDARRYLYGSES